MMLLQLPGWKPEESALSLPAAMITVEPAATAASIALWVESRQLPGPPSDRLITFAGLRLLGMPAIGRPAAQRMASLMSVLVPPHLPSTRTGRTLPPKAMPATPRLLLVTA